MIVAYDIQWQIVVMIVKVLTLWWRRVIWISLIYWPVASGIKKGLARQKANVSTQQHVVAWFVLYFSFFTSVYYFYVKCRWLATEMPIISFKIVININFLVCYITPSQVSYKLRNNSDGAISSFSFSFFMKNAWVDLKSSRNVNNLWHPAHYFTQVVKLLW